MIHDIIVNHECSIEVVEVLGVDSDLDVDQRLHTDDEASDTNNSKNFHFCILFEGKLVRGSESDMHISSYGEFAFEGDQEGADEDDDNNNEDDAMIIVEESNETCTASNDEGNATKRAIVSTVARQVEGDISTENDEKGDVDLSPLYLVNYLHTHKKYYMLYCEFDGTKVHIIHTVKIGDMIKDQLPSFIKMQRPSSYSN